MAAAVVAAASDGDGGSNYNRGSIEGSGGTGGSNYDTCSSEEVMVVVERIPCSQLQNRSLISSLELIPTNSHQS